MDDPRILRDALRSLLVAHGAFDEAKRPCGTPLAMPYAHSLLALKTRDGLSITELAENLAIDRSNVSRLVSKMVDDAVVERRPHPEDGRATALYLTATGRKRAKGVDATSAKHFSGLLEALGADADSVVTALERLRKAMEKR